MKKLFFLFIFLSISFSGFAQYGKLEPLQEGDTSNYVLRTPKETLKKFSQSTDKEVKKMGSQIESVERHLNLWRAAYTSNRLPSRDMSYFINTLKSLESKGVNVSSYIQEALLYSKLPEGRAY
ncbi:MAG: hypothetical protein H7Y13_16470 [Sphingobacteriaceae bacterium]|nr:hypothetical protein [Sphingobacteriaceae bacterium]